MREAQIPENSTYAAALSNEYLLTTTGMHRFSCHVSLNFSIPYRVLILLTGFKTAWQSERPGSETGSCASHVSPVPMPQLCFCLMYQNSRAPRVFRRRRPPVCMWHEGAKEDEDSFFFMTCKYMYVPTYLCSANWRCLCRRSALRNSWTNVVSFPLLSNYLAPLGFPDAYRSSSRLLRWLTVTAAAFTEAPLRCRRYRLLLSSAPSRLVFSSHLSHLTWSVPYGCLAPRGQSCAARSQQPSLAEGG